LTLRFRRYRHEEDYRVVERFLMRTYVEEAIHRGWPQPRWEYMHAHPSSRQLQSEFGRFGVWEDDGKMVGLVHCEDRLGVAYVQLDPLYPQLKRPMVEHAVEHLQGKLRAGPGIYVFLDDADKEFGQIARQLGFEPSEHAEMVSRLEIPDPFPAIRLPDGFRLTCLAEEFSVEKVHRCMHRGFNHEGEPPANELDDRRRKLNSPSFRRDLTMAVVAPNGDFVSFCGIWPMPESDQCYIEPVATDPDYRRMGLGTAAVMEAVRRCSLEGARMAVVGSDLAFYRSMGFEADSRHTAWWRRAESLSPHSETSAGS